MDLHLKALDTAAELCNATVNKFDTAVIMSQYNLQKSLDNLNELLHNADRPGHVAFVNAWYGMYRDALAVAVWKFIYENMDKSTGKLEHKAANTATEVEKKFLSSVPAKFYSKKGD